MGTTLARRLMSSRWETVRLSSTFSLKYQRQECEAWIKYIINTNSIHSSISIIIAPEPE